MEHDEHDVVFNAARDGDLYLLRTFLDYRPRDQVQMLVSAKTDGVTPLVIASRNGHVEVVEYLLQKCNADIELAGLAFDGDTIEGAPPLWCAAFAGHLNVVRSLVENGASLNNYDTISTPLWVACCEGHFDIVKYLVEHGADVEMANSYEHTCLMIACYKGHIEIVKYLVSLGADLNRKNCIGQTALHECMDSGNLQIMRMLLEHGAKMVVNSLGLTPLLSASDAGDAAVVEYLISLQQCSRKDRIDALELLGATYVDEKEDVLGGLKFWKWAMSERYCDGSAVMLKSLGSSIIAAYDNVVEVTTMKQLDEISSDPFAMEMQAALICERIFGPADLEASLYIKYRGAANVDYGNFEKCITLWIYALDMQQKILEPLNEVTLNSFMSFVELFFMMLNGPSRKLQVPKERFDDVMCVFMKAVHEVQKGMALPAAETDEVSMNRILMIVLNFIFLLCQLKPNLSPEQVFSLHKSVYEFVRLNPKGCNGWSPLHFACASYASEDVHQSTCSLHIACSFPSVEVAELLLEVGADPLASDTDHNALLHSNITLQCSRKDRIDALELLGATYVHEKEDILGGLKFWKWAMCERYCDGSTVMHKPRLGSSIIAAYDNVVEVTTMTQLDEISSDPDEMEMQAVLIRERILGPADLDTSLYIKYRGAANIDYGNFEKCITLWIYALDMQQKILEPLSEVTLNSFMSFVELFFQMLNGPSRKLQVPKEHFDDVMCVFMKAVHEVQKGMADPEAKTNKVSMNRILMIVLNFICLLCQLKPHLSPEQVFSLHKSVYEFVRLNPKGRNGWSPLHFACASYTSKVVHHPTCTFPTVEVLELLLEVGADPLASNTDHNTPLHIAAASKPCKFEVIKTLLKHGAHFDACNADRKCCAQLLQGTMAYDIVNPLDYTSLQCLAAKVIVREGIQVENVIPKILIDFVLLH